jgi:hypothetical protein
MGLIWHVTLPGASVAIIRRSIVAVVDSFLERLATGFHGSRFAGAKGSLLLYQHQEVEHQTSNLP